MTSCKRAATASLVAMMAMGAGGALAQPPAQLGGHVARWVGSAAKVGPADDAQVVRLKAVLGFRDHQELRRLIARQQTPGAADYRRYLTAAQFRDRFAPSAEDATKVENGLRAVGFTITGKPRSNLYVEFTGSVSQIKANFGVSQNLYAYGGKVMRANAEEPRLPASLAGLVTQVIGLDDSGQLIHPFHVRPGDLLRSAAAKRGRPNGAKATSAGPLVGLPVADNDASPYCSTYYGDTVATLSTAPAPYAAQLPWTVCGYTPQQIRAAYGVQKTSETGAGVIVAVVGAYAPPTLLADANRYSRRHKLATFTAGSNLTILYGGDLKSVSADDPCQPDSWFREISLDVEAVHAMAPGADILYSGGLSCSHGDLDSALYTVIDGSATKAGPLADIVTSSWGNDGEPLSDAEMAVDTAIYEQAAAEGVTLLFASGDQGDVAFSTGKAEASWPGSSPLVTAVGGTSLAILGPAGRKNEWGWSTFYTFLNDAMVNSSSSITDAGGGDYYFYVGSGGGPSFREPEPSYQVSVVPTQLTDVTYGYPDGAAYPLGGQYRVTPDLAMDGDPYTGFRYGRTFLIAGDPISDAGCTAINATEEYCEGPIGGTSLASPLFAGVLALAVQARHANGYGALGPLNSRLYGLTAGQQGSTTTPLIDVKPPTTPTAQILGDGRDPTYAAVLTINSVPGPWGPHCTTSFCANLDSWVLQTTPKYDDVTGMGVPYAPAFVAALSAAP